MGTSKSIKTRYKADWEWEGGDGGGVGGLHKIPSQAVRKDWLGWGDGRGRGGGAASSPHVDQAIQSEFSSLHELLDH